MEQRRLYAAILTRFGSSSRPSTLRDRRTALIELESRGETLFLMLGHPDYYPLADFRSASAAEIDSRAWERLPVDCRAIPGLW